MAASSYGVTGPGPGEAAAPATGSMAFPLPAAVVATYGLAVERVQPLTGGVINSVWRVDTQDAAYVLKRHDERTPAQVRKSIEIQQAARTHGLPVPEVMPDGRGETVPQVGGRAFVLSRFVTGTLHHPGTIPAKAARAMDEVLGRLHAALATLPPGEPRPLPSPVDVERLLLSLLEAARERRENPVDAIAEGVLEAKLDLLSRIATVPPLVLQWTHGDYEWRNVLFDAEEDVAAVIDFDDAQFYHPARDVMRCIALSFPNLEPEVDDYFAGYAVTRGLTPGDARTYVDFYRYISTFRVWPLIDRYRSPERYRPGWDGLIQPFMAWDWEDLADRLAGIAEATL